MQMDILALLAEMGAAGLIVYLVIYLTKMHRQERDELSDKHREEREEYRNDIKEDRSETRLVLKEITEVIRHINNK